MKIPSSIPLTLFLTSSSVAHLQFLIIECTPRSESQRPTDACGKAPIYEVIPSSS